MAHEPKKKHSKAAKRTRRAAIKLSSVSLVRCSNCGENILTHLACRNCGFYNGKSVVGAKTQVKVVKA